MRPPSPVLGLALAALALAVGTACAPEAGARRGSALLITLDTTRADALGSYGDERSSPTLDALAAESIRFERAHAVAPLTLPSHASLLTGLYPPRHTVRDNGLGALPSSALTVAEAAAQAGVQTAAFVAAVVLDASFGLDQGFETYVGPERPEMKRASVHTERQASAVVDDALAWLADRDRERPFFLWVHLFDPHAPYVPPEDLRASVDPRPLYQGEVAYADREIERLLAALRESGADDETLVVFTSDHGEAFGEHGEERHGANGYQTTIRVPLLVRLPDGSRAGEVSRAVVSGADVAPTLAQALGVSLADGIDGRSLLEPLSDERGVYFESYAGYFSFGYSPMAGWVNARGKYVHSSAPQFFDLDQDPAEDVNLAEEVDTELWRRAIDAVVSAPPLPLDETQGIGAELRAEVRSLGYATIADPESIPHPLAPSERPSPADSTVLHSWTLQAMDLANAGAFERALAIFSELAEGNPENFIALENLGVCYLRLDRPLEAIEPLQALLRRRPELSDSHYNLGLALWHAQRLEEAIESLRRAVELEPDRGAFRKPLIDLLRMTGRDEEAEEQTARLQALDTG